MEKTTFTFENRDGLAQLSEVPDNSVRMVLTDPPYLIAHIGPTGKAYEHFDTTDSFTMEQLEKFVKEWNRVLAPGGTLVCWFDTFKIGDLRTMCEKAKFGGRYRVVRWVKDGGNQVEVKQTYVGWGESALVCHKPPVKEIVFNNRGENGKAIAHRGLFTARTPRGGERFHPTQKPVDLFEELICLHTNPGDVVLDSFCGSGVTPVACALTGRSFIGAELNKEYFDKAQERLAMLDSEDRSQSSLIYTPEFKPKVGKSRATAK